MKRWAIASLPLLVILALVVPSRASPQSGVFCPDTGAVIITMLDGTYFGTATQVDGGLYAGYIFWAQDPFSGRWITGYAEAFAIDCLMSIGRFELVRMRNLTITDSGYL